MTRFDRMNLRISLRVMTLLLGDQRVVHPPRSPVRWSIPFRLPAINAIRTGSTNLEGWQCPLVGVDPPTLPGTSRVASGILTRTYRHWPVVRRSRWCEVNLLPLSLGMRENHTLPFGMHAEGLATA